MTRLYVEKDMARFFSKDIALVDMELSDGRKFENLEPRRLFPMSRLDKYITLLDGDGAEVAVIRDLNALPTSDREIIEDCLKEYYLIPKITKLNSLTVKNGKITIDACTDRGNSIIEIRGIVQSFKLLRNNRVLIRDISDNRYEIPDLSQLDRHSISLIDSFL